MPAYNGTTEITNVQVPAYTVTYWSTATSAEIQTAIMNGQIYEYVAGTAPYQFTAYQIRDTNNYRLVQQASFDNAPVIEKLRHELRTEAYTIFAVEGGARKVVYCKRKFTIRKWMTLKEWFSGTYDCNVSISVDRELPMDTKFTFYFRKNLPPFSSIIENRTISNGQTYCEASTTYIGNGVGIPPAWSCYVHLIGGYYAGNSHILISDASGDHASGNTITLY